MDVRLVVVAGLLVVSSVSAADAAVACPCFADCGADPPYVQFGESCFRHHWAALGWTEARAACARDGGVLAENVGYLVHADSRIDTWIGARAASSEPAELRWQSSGEPLVDGLPQNVTVHPSTFPEGGCAFILESHIYVWSECDDPLAFICERPVVDIVPAQLHLSAARAWGQTHGTGASTLSLGVTSPLLSSNPGSVTKAVVQPRNFRFALAQVASSTVSFSVRQSACQQLSASQFTSPSSSASEPLNSEVELTWPVSSLHLDASYTLCWYMAVPYDIGATTAGETTRALAAEVLVVTGAFPSVEETHESVNIGLLPASIGFKSTDGAELDDVALGLYLNAVCIGTPVFSSAGSPVTVPRSLAVATYYVCLCPWYGVAPAGNGFPTFSSTSSTITVHAVPEFTPAAVYLPHAFALSGEGTVGVSGQNLHQSYLWIAFSLSSSCSVSSLEEEAVVPLEMGDRNAFVRIPVGSPTGKPLYLCWSVSLRSPAEVYSWASTSILLTITAAPVPTVLPSVSNETFTYGQAIPGPSITVLGRNFETRNREETYLWYATSPLQSCEGDLSLGGEVAGSTLQAVGKVAPRLEGSFYVCVVVGWPTDDGGVDVLNVYTTSSVVTLLPPPHFYSSDLFVDHQPIPLPAGEFTSQGDALWFSAAVEPDACTAHGYILAKNRIPLLPWPSSSDSPVVYYLCWGVAEEPELYPSIVTWHPTDVSFTVLPPASVHVSLTPLTVSLPAGTYLLEGATVSLTGTYLRDFQMVWTADGSEAYTSITASKSDGCISSCLRLVSVPEDLQGSQEYGVSIRFLSGSRAGVDVPANVTHRMVASPSVTGSPTLVVSASDYYSGGALQLTGAGFDFAWVKMVAESCSASGNPAKVGAGGAISFSSEDERLAPGSERLLCLAEGTTGPLSGWFSAGVVVEVRNMPQFEPELWAPSPGEVWGSAVPYSIVLQGLDLDQALEYYHCAWKETEPADCVTGCSPPQHSDAGIVSLEFDYARAPGKRQVCWQLHDQQPGEDGASTGVVVLVPNLNPFSASATTLTYSDALFAGAYFPLSNVGAGVEGLCGALVPATAVSGGFAGRNCAEIEIFSEPASGLLPAPLSTASAGAEHVLLLSYNGQTARFFATDNRVTWDAAPSFDASGTVMPLSLGDLSSGVLNLTLTARHLTPGFTIGVSSNLCTDTISAGQLSSPFRLAPGEISSTGAVTLAIPEPFRASLPAPASTKAWLCWAPIDPSSGLSSWTNGGDTGIELQFRSTPSLTSGAATEHVDIEVKRYDLLANGQPDFVVSIDGARLSSPLWVVAHTVSCAEAYSQRTPFSFIFSLSVADETAGSITLHNASSWFENPITGLHLCWSASSSGSYPQASSRELTLTVDGKPTFVERYAGNSSVRDIVEGRGEFELLANNAEDAEDLVFDIKGWDSVLQTYVSVLEGVKLGEARLTSVTPLVGVTELRAYWTIINPFTNTVVGPSTEIQDWVHNLSSYPAVTVIQDFELPSAIPPLPNTNPLVIRGNDLESAFFALSPVDAGCESITTAALLPLNVTAHMGRFLICISVTGAAQSFYPVRQAPVLDLYDPLQITAAPILTSEPSVLPSPQVPEDFTNIPCLDEEELGEVSTESCFGSLQNAGLLVSCLRTGGVSAACLAVYDSCVDDVVAGCVDRNASFTEMSDGLSIVLGLDTSAFNSGLFTAAVAASLKVLPHHVVITSVSAGSVVVDFFIQGPNASQDQDTLFHLVEEQQNPFESFQWDILSLRVAAIFEQPPEVRITSTDSDSLEEKLQRIFRLACLGAAGVCVVMVLGLGVTRMRGYRQLQDQRRSPKRLSSVASDNGARSDRTTALGESSGECKRTKAVPIPPGLERFNPPEAADSRSPAALRGANAVVRSPVFSPRMPVSAPPFTQPLQPVISASSCHHSSAPTSRANSLQQLAPLSVPSHGFPPLPAIPATMESI